MIDQALPERVAVCQPLPKVVSSWPWSRTSTVFTPLPGRAPIAGSLAVPLRSTVQRPVGPRVGFTAAVGVLSGTCGGCGSARTVMAALGGPTLPTLSVARERRLYAPSVTWRG